MNASPAGSRWPDGGWWQGGVLYHLYVRSWLDTSGDGHGDLAGVTARLDYLSWLGVDGIWLSPIMPSPDQDWGYDVSDYRSVHPGLGTMDDLDRLIAEAGRRGLRILLDLVPNHTSSAHPWFVDARRGRHSQHRGYYVWADGAAGGAGAPNNWLDSTGGSAWAWDEASGEYYLHNFLDSQPDLNWREPAVHDEFREIIRFWFDRGVAGFRIDVAHGLYKDARLRDNPPQAVPGPLHGRRGQQQVYNANQPESHGVFRDWRAIAESYAPPRLLLGETWVGDLDQLAGFYGTGDELQLAFNFPFVYSGFTAPDLPGVVAATLDRLPAGCCPVWTASNHDVGRFPTRWCDGDRRKVMLALLVLMTLPGTTVLYYGDEIGMTDVPVPPSLRRDLMSRSRTVGRDRARTPMQWDATPSAGFSAAARPWLPVGDAACCNVAAQRDDPGSVLSLCRELIALRRRETGGRVAGYRQLRAPVGIWAYQTGGLTVVANLSERPMHWAGAPGEILLATPAGADGGPGVERGDAGVERGDAGVSLGAWQGLVARGLP
jgi:alpha-glucosidase